MTEPGFMVTEIKIRVVADGPRRCRATITYRRSALVERANAIVNSLDAHWAGAQAPHWEGAINDALHKRMPRD